MGESSRTIDERAAQWAARLSDGPLSATDHDELQRWLDADSRRLGAFAKARAVLAHAKAGAFGADADIRMPVASRRRFVMWGGAMAASLVGGVALWRHALPDAGVDYTTVKGEVRMVTLPDGSSITLNTDTSVRVAFDAARRLVTLIRGEALFSVVAGLKAPFIVEVDGARFTASAARFVVSKLAARPMEIIVRNGTIRFPGAGASGGGGAIVRANMHAVAAPGGTLKIATLPADRISARTSWVDGMLFFDDTPLSDALAEFARYTDTPIVLDNSALGRKTISGTFAASDPVGFSEAVSKVLDLRLRKVDGTLHLTR